MVPKGGFAKVPGSRYLNSLFDCLEDVEIKRKGGPAQLPLSKTEKETFGQVLLCGKIHTLSLCFVFAQSI